ncbi:MAG: type II toxin-antitoxin system VapC family toxin [Actinomycetota bacterium]|nr:type II toxin-antitoxin system VapC family toxin [Actinomycetota bacterium]
MIVVDASAVVTGLLNDGPSRRWLGADQLHVPHLIDSEVASGLRRRVLAREIGDHDGWAALDTWRHLAATRYAVHTLLERVWQLRSNLSAYDAGYVALAEQLDCSLVTADARLSLAPGTRCPITVVPR